jgi:hypothetical protein
MHHLWPAPQHLGTEPSAPAAAAAGAVLEMVRDVATALAADGKRVKVVVQQALGQGVFQASRAGGGGSRVSAGWGTSAPTHMPALPWPCLLPPAVHAAPRGDQSLRPLAWLCLSCGQTDPLLLPPLPLRLLPPPLQGTPLSLNGVMRIMKQMDWGDSKGG